ncbi:hypothetical protein [Halomicronema sp. CCY15110]|uniref:hypothetical protein n=1 Tax=Halomicronema sp. CCY15110 TaxID=2767773 RepID=UPI00194FBC26|nr:hypothetical protein [Halomicronema sp. CCY15110]
MTSNAILDAAPELTASAYVVVGVAICFRRVDDELESIKVLEPIPSAYLESLFLGIPTAYEVVMATTLGDLQSDQFMNQASMADVRLCENYRDRVIASARTYDGHPEAKSLMAVGTQHTDLNHSTEKKRILNFKNIVKAEDNVRQHAHTHKKL